MHYCRQVLPSELISLHGLDDGYNNVDVPLRRAFGGWAISKSQRASRVLAEHQIAHIELDGTTHTHGSMAGGFLGGGTSVLQTAFDFQRDTATEQSLAVQLTELEQKVEQVRTSVTRNACILEAREKLHQLSAMAEKLTTQQYEVEARVGVLRVEERTSIQRATRATQELECWQAASDSADVHKAMVDEVSKLHQLSDNLRHELQSIETRLTTSVDDEAQVIAKQKALQTAASSSTNKRGTVQLQASIDQQVIHLKYAEGQVAGLAATIEQIADEIEQASAYLEKAQEQVQANSEEAEADAELCSETTKSIKACKQQIGALVERHAELAQSKQLSNQGYEEPDRIPLPTSAELGVSIQLWTQKIADIRKQLGKSATTVDIAGLRRKQQQRTEFLHKRDTIDQGIERLTEGIAAARETKLHRQPCVWNCQSADDCGLLSFCT
jgi:chromosome segregation ATPase